LSIDGHPGSNRPKQPKALTRCKNPFEDPTLPQCVRCSAYAIPSQDSTSSAYRPDGSCADDIRWIPPTCLARDFPHLDVSSPYEPRDGATGSILGCASCLNIRTKVRRFVYSAHLQIVLKGQLQHPRVLKTLYDGGSHEVKSKPPHCFHARPP